MLRTLRCIFSLWIFANFTLLAQHTGGMKVGVDIIPPITKLLRSGQTGFEGTMDLNFAHKYFLVLEPGFLNSTYTDSAFRYKGSGSFLRIGIDKNILKNPKFKGNDLITMGVRYGITRMNASASDIILAPSYWNPAPGIFFIPSSSYFTQWVELCIGVKAEVLKNFYIGWSLSGRLLLSSGHPNELTPYLVPGYGRGDSKSVFGFHYYLCYRIPFQN
jgi:hypothetical protein